MSAGGASIGLALGRLRDRAQLVNFLVARLKQKVWPPPDTCAVQVFHGTASPSVPQFPSKEGVIVRSPVVPRRRTGSPGK